MNNRTYRATATPPVMSPVAKVQPTQVVERKQYFTGETVVLWLVYILMVAANAAIEVGQLGGVTSATIAYATFTWFTPAGYVFSIWSVIYVALIFWLVSYTRAAPTRPRGFSAVSLLFIASSFLNVFWLILWHFNAVAAGFVVILIDWFVLFSLYRTVRRDSTSRFSWVPISIYTAWITVATVANLAILITQLLNGSTDILNAVSVVLLTAGVLSLGYAMKQKYHDWVFPLVFLWALVGVGVHVLEVSAVAAGMVFFLSAVGAILTFGFRAR